MGLSLRTLIALVTVAGTAGASAADYSPIDCAKARGPALTTICNSYSLGQSEARMATLYGIATSLVGMGQRGDLGDAQVAWLKTRDACGAGKACLAKAYELRIDQLSKVLSGIASRGPF